MAGNSTIQLQQIADDAATMGDLAPALATGGFSDAPALSIANDVIAAMLLGGAQGQPFNWKWNRFNPPAFPTISYQQDYFIPGLVNLGWMEDAWASNISSTQIPKEKRELEVRRDLEVEYWSGGYPSKICWIPNDIALTGTWGAHPLGPTASFPQGETTVVNTSLSGIQNPGPNVIYTNPLGSPSGPINATTAIKDPNGNFWAMTTYGTCGSSQPAWPANPVYPTYTSQSIVATTVTDGTAVWTAINPKGQAIRVLPLPPQTGVVWLIQPVCQKRVPIFTSLSQTLEPVPDDYATYFKQGFFAQCYRRNPDPKVRAKFKEEWQLWMESLDKATKQGQREIDDYGFYPTQSLMDSNMGMYVGPAYPWPHS